MTHNVKITTNPRGRIDKQFVCFNKLPLFVNSFCLINTKIKYISFHNVMKYLL